MTPAARTSTETILQNILDAAREAIFVVDGGMTVVASNQAARSSFSRPGFGLDGRRVSEVIRDIDLHEAFRSALAAGERSDIRLELQNGGSEKRIYDVHVAPFDGEARRYAIGFFYNVSKIERLEKVRQEFLSNISHELRTPLTSIIAFVETLEDGALEDAENNRRFLSVIHRNAERMHDLIADILELSLIESGKVSIEKVPVTPFNMVNEIFVTLSSRSAGDQIAMHNAIPEGLRVPADPVRLEQMLTNLIDNAIKFNRHGGSVTVFARENDGRVVISVSDMGEGIRPENLGRIFERFYRIDRGRSRDIGGTGLGLAIVKHLAKLQGGEVSAESELGSGSIFHIELPGISDAGRS